MKLSIVTTLYNSSPFVDEFYDRITRAAETITPDYELIFVNDGSPDDSLEKVLELRKKDARIVVVDLSRNFGHHKAIMTGLGYAKGNHVFQIDSDLEEEPELLKTFWDELFLDTDVDVVYGVQENRKGGWFERVSGKLFYKLYNKLASVSIPKDVIAARLMKRKYVNALLEFKEQEIFLAGLWSAAGFNQKAKLVVKHKRNGTNYSLGKKISLVVNSVTSFSEVPLRAIFLSGAGITLFSFSYVFFLVIWKFFFEAHIDGWTTIVVSIWLLGGLILFSIGIIGIYLSKIFMETKNRPYTLVKDVYGLKKDD